MPRYQIDYTIYTIPKCPWCTKATELLDYVSASWSGWLIVDEGAKRNLMDSWEVPEGERTWPQIFLDGKRIGGYTELKAHLTANL